MAHIVVVEDNPTLLENITFELEMAGYEVTTAIDGREALNVLQKMKQHPDLIVSDIAMPHLDGFELLDAVRENNDWNAIPFIFLTAYNTKHAMRLGKQLGVDDYLLKPFEAEELVLTIENKLKRQKEIHEKAERGLDEKRRALVNMIAHELRTPMTTMYGGLEMLEFSLQSVSDDTTSELLHLVQAGSQRLHRLVNRVVIMVQLESGHLQQALENHPEAIDINALIISTLQSLDLASQNVEANVRFEAEKLHVVGIDEYVKQVVFELLDNAVKFSPAYSDFSVQTKAKGNHAHIIITDKGRGIPKEDINRIWDYFTQIDRQSYEQQGIGLGLTIVREIVKAHGGDCEILSTSDQGTKIRVILPLAK